MKTNKLPSKKYRFELWLTILGWSLAVFVSLLYLHEKSTIPSVHDRSPSKLNSVTTTVAGDRVEELLAEARNSLEAHRPELTIERVTTLWSVCHSKQRPVPEDSHRLFAEAVSALSARSRPRPPRPPVLSFPEQQDQITNVEASVAVKVPNPTAKGKKSDPVTFELPKLDYPRSQVKPRPKSPVVESGRAPATEETTERPIYREPSRYPAPPPPYQANRGDRPTNMRRGPGARPLPPPPPGGGPPPHPGGPFELRGGGPPRGY